MKKIFLLTVLICLMVCGNALAIDALADNTPTDGDGYSIYGGVDAADAVGAGAVLLGKMSKGVYFVGNVDDEDPKGEGYAVATKHLSGTKQYGTAHDSTSIFFLDVGTAPLAALADFESREAFTSASWTAM